jgi:phosphinothricin acetyltransferase
MLSYVPASEPRIRPVEPRDLSRLTDIYNHYVGDGAVTFDTRPFLAEERRGWLAQFAERGPHRLFVAERDGVVQGYAGSMRFREKPAYETSVETTIYVAPEATGRGLGALLYQALFASLRGEDLHRVYAGITLPNEASLRLHERFTFRRVALYHEVGRKAGRYWDVAWYEKAL